MSGDVDPFDLADRIALNAMDDQARTWVQSGFARWMRCGGVVPLERCLGLPKTRKQAKRRECDYWLKKAALMLNKGTPHATLNALADELDAFVSRGPWRVWQALPAPPEGASELRTALFYAVKANDGKTIKTRQLDRRIGHIFRVK